MTYCIRKASEIDKKSVLELGKKIVDVYERTHLGDEVVDGYINSGACENDFLNIYDSITLMFKGDNLVGLISTNSNEIQGFLVDIPYWGTGAAKYLLDYAEKNIFKEYDEITLECFENSPRANRFYIKNGFIKTGLKDGDGGRRIVYKKDLS